jgi:hypothetical protein
MADIAVNGLGGYAVHEHLEYYVDIAVHERFALLVLRWEIHGGDFRASIYDPKVAGNFCNYVIKNIYD